MRNLCVIPARMGSSRFPGKPLAKILGKPMVGHVYGRATIEPVFDKVVVATCDREIAEYCASKDIPWVMTSDKHERASERIAEATEILEKEQKVRFETVTLLQGDEPMTTPSMLRAALNGLNRSDHGVLNLAATITSKEEFLSVNCVKVVMAKDGSALYFSRAPIPSTPKSNAPMPRAFKQICVIPFRRDFLDWYLQSKSTYLEEFESVDMNRILELGKGVQCVEIEENTYPVDVEADRLKVEAIMKSDPYLQKYLARI